MIIGIEQMTIGKPFELGRAKSGGRLKGSRNKISEAFLKDLAAEWEVSGPAALKCMAKEDPSGFVKVTAALLPKEFTIDDNRLKDVSDEELEILINELRGKLRSAIIEHPGSREGSETHH
jgi:hypothetical protein